MTKLKKKSDTKKNKKDPTKPCPIDKHWVSPHSRTRKTDKGKPYTQSVRGHCRTNRGSNTYGPSDLRKMRKQNESVEAPHPCNSPLDFGKDGIKYDDLIALWTKLWNDIFKVTPPLDPDTVKALIASESSFNPKAWNHQHGPGAAYGLTQITIRTLPQLNSDKELRDYYIDITKDDLFDPDVSIGAGVRWLFRKREIAKAKYGNDITWRDAVREYKGYKPTDKVQKGMHDFDDFLRKYKEACRKLTS